MASSLVVTACVAGMALHALQARPSAQSPTPSSGVTAIVGARIIDGSGNGPFEGTVVIRGDRIAEVGRTVAPPEGARIIDAKGRTVLPALVDLGVELPRAGSDEEMARALAAYLYAGVTSIVPLNLTAAEIDALRDRIGRSGLQAPRLAIAADATRFVRGAASGGALADSQALTDWKQRNVTYVPELALAAPADRRAPTPLLQQMTPSDGPAAGNGGNGGNGGASGPVPGGPAVSGPAVGGPAAGGPATGAPAAGGAADPARWKALLDQTRAARDAGVRLGIGSGAGTRAAAGVGVAGVGSGAGAAAAPAGTTAGAGAGASAAGAPDAGGTSTGTGSGSGSGAAALVPHGWGTILAARLLVDAGVTPLQAVTAATSGGTWALSLQSDRGFLAVGQRADLLLVVGDPSSNIGDLERVERVFLGGSEVDRGAVRALITRPVVIPPPTPDPTAAAAAAARKTPPPDPRTPAGRRALREARAARAKGGVTPPDATAETAGSASTASAAAPPSTAVGPAGTTGAAPGNPGSTMTTTAAAAAAGGASIAASAALLDDFENGDDAGTLGKIWTSAAESANSTTTVVAGRVVRGARDHALHVTARMGNARDSHARVSIKVAQDGRPLDVSRFHGLRFDARGQGRYRVVFISRGVSDGHYHEAYFSGSPNWTPVGIQFASVGQTGATHRVQWTGRDLLEIVFQISRDPGDIGWLELDNVRFY